MTVFPYFCCKKEGTNRTALENLAASRQKVYARHWSNTVKLRRPDRMLGRRSYLELQLATALAVNSKNKTLQSYEKILYRH